MPALITKDDEDPPALQALDLVDVYKTLKPEIVKTEEEWRKQLTPEQYQVARRKGTEPAFTGQVLGSSRRWHVYLRVLRHPAIRFGHQVRFRLRMAQFHGSRGSRERSDRNRYKLWDAARRSPVQQVRRALGACLRRRAEPTNLRYCINSAALNFEKKK